MEASEDKHEEVEAILLVINESNDEKAIISAFDILMKLVKNVLKCPHEEKFRNIKKTNKAIASKLLSLSSIEDLLLALGYTDSSDEFYIFDITNYSDLTKLYKILESFHDERRKKYMTPEELNKYELLKAQKKKMIEEHKKRQSAKSELERGMKLDRKEKAQEEVKASKGNNLNFGANVVKFQPPAPERGR
mmetsp:Transcript_17930/g.15837  ORF Transcript_17930/g.15837 Transcript_17930/m.15837 type:complete len:191 (-) Transcript_17930:193-765(-)|eukprot:CAMPEP_0205815060 /NCGR_PEP_ID=MMETSP0205-20121125/20518_1 /ASSEMBLY_ACC=CAM_ASM_000278 /TAXON_ID=36767 /ORGANISM="Euplotes focardii, Strain TN1" /LENGTH=190 /DNA_ID=CAMNT_0053100369 /DNA_START=1 /DNA_END=573 /DNA_ORIENTATION=-